ncbi:MAG: hypothetical protein H6906_06105 [Hyphomicrobiales bacterium]|nr:hypothetical protein [Hyphomicrobiales bacterium]
MTNPAPRLLAVLAACLMALSGARAGAAPGFDALLDEAAATFAPPAGFAAAPVRRPCRPSPSTGPWPRPMAA